MEVPERQNPAGSGNPQPGLKQSSTQTQFITPKQTKLQRVLSAFMAGKTLNRFEAARELRDWCLHSTVSELEGKGVLIDRTPETVPGAYGPVHCKRYKLNTEPGNVARADDVLRGQHRAGGTPIR
jgi:hypothetical protein